MTFIASLLAAIVILAACPAPAHADFLGNQIVSPGLLIKGHKKEDENCDKCHKKFDKAAQSRLCSDCHKEIGKDINEKSGYHGRLDQGKPCKECHTEHKGRDARIAEFDQKKFDHTLTDYLLKDAHLNEKVKCADCHKPGKKFREAPVACNECHKKDDKHKGNFGAKCESCHVVKSWKEILFDHDKKTKYPLLGKHREARCSGCHKGDLFKEKIKTACISCHVKDDKHKKNFGQKCESCHVEKSWKEILFDHDKQTKYLLLGKHKDAKCVACHKGDLYKEKLQAKCNSCHQKDDKHKGNFGQKCESCHIEKDWKEIPFDHDQQTKYPLLGKHKQAKCVSCHKGDLYKDKLSSDCLLCHEKDDKHRGQEGKKCGTCHGEQSWTKTTFNHGKMSKFPLLGRHTLVDCKKCHAAATFKDAKPDCWSCHEKDDVHKRRLGQDCQACHNARDWKAWDFNHDKTSFKLGGAHKKVSGKCMSCHRKVMDKKVVLSGACGSCHDRDDVHGGNFGDRCDRCHDGDTWQRVKMGGQVPRTK